MKKNIHQISNNMFFGAPAESFMKASLLRKNMTVAESILWEELRNKRLLNLKFRRQHPIGIYIVDFYCHELKLVIEVDGEYHQFKDQMQKDFIRTEILEEFGLKVVRFNNEEIENNKTKVLETLDTIIKNINPIKS